MRFQFQEYRMTPDRVRLYRAFVEIAPEMENGEKICKIPWYIPDEYWIPYYGRWRIVKGKRYRRR